MSVWQVTVFGHSAGAMAVQLLLLSGRTAGLFRAAILQSGPVLSAFSHSDKHPAYYGRSLAAAVGCPPEETSAVLLSCLQAKPLHIIVEQTRLFDHEDGVMRNAPSPWKPLLDGLYLPVSQAFLTEDPLVLLQRGSFTNIPVIIGSTKDEGLYAVTEVLARRGDAADVLLRDWGRNKGPGYMFGREEDEIDLVDTELADKFLSQFLESGRSREPLLSS